MRVFVTGGTGLIGRNLVRRLLERGDTPVVLSRQSDKFRRNPEMRTVQVVQGDPTVAGGWDSAVDGCDAVVNLAGHNLFADRWTPRIKRTIRDSRVHSTEHVVAAVSKARVKPRILVQGSAIGYYGAHHDETLTEDSPSGSDFMAVVCREWEDAAHPAEALGLRLATIRTGVVLARGEGALGAMTPLYKMFLGAAPVGSGGNLLKPATGQQWMSWIHIDDIVGILLLALDNPEARGPINGTSPNPVHGTSISAKPSRRSSPRPFLPLRPSRRGPRPGPRGGRRGVITEGPEGASGEGRGPRLRVPSTPEVLAALKAVFAKESKAAPAPPPPARRPSGHHH